MPLWDPEAAVPSIQVLKDASTPTVAPVNPRREAARMAALKRLRHRLVSLCSSSSSSSNIKPPVLAFERWISRAALRRDLSSSSLELADPIIPSDGVIDEGLIKDLSRSMPETVARSIAETMARDGKSAAEKVSAKGDTNEETKEKKDVVLTAERKQIKVKTKAVKKAAKLVQKSLDTRRSPKPNEEEDGNDDDDDVDSDRDDLESSLASLREATKELDNFATQIQRNSGYATQISIDSSRRPGIHDVALIGPNGAIQKPYLTISSAHLQKLLDLWAYSNEQTNKKSQQGKQQHQTKTTNSKKTPNKNRNHNDPMTNINLLCNKDRISFLNSVYCCLARYEGLKGAGYQCAIPPQAFKAAATTLGLGTTIECFASPFNCCYRRYCSAFPGIECRLGSLGSFFDDTTFWPIEGSFEANPPFVPEIMNEMSNKLDRLLSNAKAKALSFLVVVPAWGTVGIQFCEDLESSKYVRSKKRITASDHAYCDGSQHNLLVRKQGMAPLRPSSWDTAVILLQNDIGSEKWPVKNKELDHSFCEAFKKSFQDLPKEASTIEKWEQRGVGRGGRATNTGSGSSNSRPSKRFRHET